MTASDWEALVECASAADIAQLAPHFGLELVRCGRGFRHREYDSLKISGNLWKRWSGKTGVLGQYTKGRTIQLIQEYTGLPFRKAVLEIAAHADPALYARATGSTGLRLPLEERSRRAQQTIGDRIMDAAEKEKRSDPFRLPARSRCAEDVFQYLTEERHLDPEIVKRELTQGRLYQDTRKNCVFVGYDEHGLPAFGATRATQRASVAPKMDVRGSRKEYSWRAVPPHPSGTVFVFESPIEAMSYMSILRQEGQDWERSAYLSLGGVAPAALTNYLRGAPQTKTVYVCLNNDEAGRAGAAKLLALAGDTGLVLLPGKEGSDWNDALRDYRVGEMARPVTDLEASGRASLPRAPPEAARKRQGPQTQIRRNTR